MGELTIFVIGTILGVFLERKLVKFKNDRDAEIARKLNDAQPQSIADLENQLKVAKEREKSNI